MNNSTHFKKTKILVQLSDGSSIYLFCHNHKKELLMESDIRSNSLWKNNALSAESAELAHKQFKVLNRLFVDLKK